MGLIFFVARCTTVIVLHFWLYGVCMYCMDQYHVNHGFILEVDPDTRLTFSHVFEFAALLTLFVFVSLSLMCLSVVARLLPAGLFDFYRKYRLCDILSQQTDGVICVVCIQRVPARSTSSSLSPSYVSCSVRSICSFGMRDGSRVSWIATDCLSLAYVCT
jgi:hypothetical protein